MLTPVEKNNRRSFDCGRCAPSAQDDILLNELIDQDDTF